MGKIRQTSYANLPLMSCVKVAIVYDRATTEYGGAEYLLELLAKAFPEADLLAPIVNRRLSWTKNFKRIEDTWLNRLPLAKRYYRHLLPLMPIAVESLDLSQYRVIISVSSGEAKGVVTRANQYYLSYIFTPPRYLYQLDEQYPQANQLLQQPIIRQLLMPIWRYLKWWDLAAAARPDKIATLSAAAAKRINQVYQRPAQVIYPPARDLRPLLSQFMPKSATNANYFLFVGRLVEYKRADLAINAALLNGNKLLLVGSGPDLSKLIQISRANTWLRPSDMSLEAALVSPQLKQAQIVFLGSVLPAELAWLYAHAQLVLSPGVDDYGLVPLEAAYFGTPSLINQASGVSEILKPPLAGLIDQTNINQIAQTIKQILPFSHQRELEAKAQTISSQSFIESMKELVYDYDREK